MNHRALLVRARDALAPFAAAVPEGAPVGYGWSTRTGHSVHGLRVGIAPCHFLEAQAVHGELEELTREDEGWDSD